MNQDVLTHINEIRNYRTKYLNGEYGNITLNEFKTQMEGLFGSFCEKCPVIFERATEGFDPKGERVGTKRVKATTNTEKSESLVTTHSRYKLPVTRYRCGQPPCPAVVA